MDGAVLAEQIGLVPILRAGLGMTDALLDLLPTAEVQYLGFYRDEETLQPVEYYRKFSSHPPDLVFVLDPMLATGGSAAAGIDLIKKCLIRRICGLIPALATRPLYETAQF